MSAARTFRLGSASASGSRATRVPGVRNSEIKKPGGIRRRICSPVPALCLTAAFLAGCGGSSDVQEIPEASKKALIQRKVDVKAGKAKPSKAGRGAARG